MFIIYRLIRITLKIKRMFYIWWNLFIFSVAGVKIGMGMKIYNKVYLQVSKNSSIDLGDNLVITSGDSINPLCRNQRACIYVREGARLTIGDDCGFSSPCIWCDERITIGNRVNVGGDCIIIDSDAHSLDYRDRAIESKVSICEKFSKVKHAPIVIEDDVWIGVKCIIMKGVTIGARSVIGAGSIVTKDVPPDTMVCGVPAKVIKNLR